MPFSASFVQQFSVDMHAVFIRTGYIKAARTHGSVIEIRTVLQRKQIWIDSLPELVAERGTQVFNNESITLLAIAASAVALGYGQFYFCHGFDPRFFCEKQSNRLYLS